MTKSHNLSVVIGSSDCDALGHMNVARYIALCNQCGTAMQTAMGWVPGELRDGVRLSFAAVRMESEFLSEVLEGETLFVYSDIYEIGTKSATFRNRILREDGKPVYLSKWKSACLNLDTRRAHPIPDAFRAALQEYLVEDLTVSA